MVTYYLTDGDFALHLTCFAVAAALCASSLAAHAATIDFSTLGYGHPPITTYTENGFTVDVTAGSFDGTFFYGDPSPSIFTPNGSGTITVTDGGLFTFSSVALGTQDPGTAVITITGLLNGLSLFTENVTVSAFQFIAPYSFSADSAIVINSLQIAVTGAADIDNIAVSAAVPMAVTPELSSIALLGTGMLGVAGVVRKRFA